MMQPGDGFPEGVACDEGDGCDREVDVTRASVKT